MPRPGLRGALALVVGNLLLSILLLALAGAGLELYYRFVYDETDTANRSKLSKRWFDRYWHENSDEIRDDVDYPRPIAEGRRRITFLGDSYTAGHGLKRVEDRFAHRLRAARPDWEVHTLAYNGINTVEEIDVLRRFLADGYQLDSVVLVYVYNDIDSFIAEFQEFYRHIDVPPAFLAPLLDHSYAADLYYQRWRQRDAALRSGIPYPVLRSEAYEGRPWKAMEHALDQLAKEVWEQDARFAAVTFPWMQMLAAGEVELPMYAKLEDFWSSRDVPHLQLLPELLRHVDEDLLVNRRDTHPNARAHEIAAQALLPFLEERVLPLPGGPPAP